MKALQICILKVEIYKIKNFRLVVKFTKKEKKYLKQLLQTIQVHDQGAHDKPRSTNR